MSLEGLAKELLRKMADYQYEIRFLEAAAPELKRYLLSEEVYWNLGLRSPAGKRPYPQFSLGWLLVFRRRLGAYNAADARKDMNQMAIRVRQLQKKTEALSLQESENHIDRLRAEIKFIWEKIAGERQSISSRMDKVLLPPMR